MKKADSEKIIPFILSVTAFHVITYFIAGIIASSVFNYKQFIAPLTAIFICAMTGTDKIILKYFVLYAVSALSILIYGKIILGSAELLYALSAPILPVIISFLLMNRKRKTGDVLKTQSDTD